MKTKTSVIIGVLLTLVLMPSLVLAKPYHAHRGPRPALRVGPVRPHHPPAYYHHKHCNGWIVPTILGTAAATATIIDAVTPPASNTIYISQPSTSTPGAIIREEIKPDGTRIIYYAN